MTLFAALHNKPLQLSRMFPGYKTEMVFLEMVGIQCGTRQMIQIAKLVIGKPWQTEIFGQIYSSS